MSKHDEIKSLIESYPCVLFMKGTQDFPQCGFSQHAVMILRKYQVNFHTVNILEDQEMRQELKVFSDWPTFPQLYVNQEFIGGVDILREMDEASELTALFEEVA